MAIMQSIVLVSAVLLVVLVNQGSSIKCYECNSHLDPRCAMDSLPESLITNCIHPKNYCRKIVQEIEFSLDAGSAIRCYECNSYNDTRCAQDIPPMDLSIECTNQNKGVKYTFCRKIKQIIEFSVNQLPADTRIIRGCGWDDSTYKNKCYQRSGFGGRQEVCACAEENCNGSETLKISVATFAISSAFILLAYSAHH